MFTCTYEAFFRQGLSEDISPLMIYVYILYIKKHLFIHNHE